MTPDELTQILLSVPAFEPKALLLLRQRQQATGQVQPAITQVERMRAFYEMQQVSKQASNAADKLLKLEPVPLSSPHMREVEEFYL